jgi:hypothetical protein
MEDDMRLSFAALVSAGVLVVGCSSTPAPAGATGTACTPAAQTSCACGAGLGSMTCGANGQYGSCVCGLTGATAGAAVPKAGTGVTGFAGTGAAPIAGFSGIAPVAGRLAVAGSGGAPVAGSGGAAGLAPTAGKSGAGGASGAGGSIASGGSGGGTAPTGGSAPKLPDAPANCPMFTNNGVVNIPRVSGEMVPVTIYIDPAAKSKPAPGGPLVVYWHATLSSPAEVLQGFGQANISAVTAAGGVVAAPATTTCNGCTTTDDGYWYEEDDVVLDQIVACAVKEANIDVNHIHTLGWSAGALHTTHVAQVRSNYIASFISYSGGLAFPTTDEDPTNKVPGILTYGDPGSDVVILDFNAQSQTWYTTFQPMGWYVMMCHHPGGHEVDPMVAPLSLKFFQDHPYKVSPEPYATMIPAGYPSYCANMPK